MKNKGQGQIGVWILFIIVMMVIIAGAFLDRITPAKQTEQEIINKTSINESTACNDFCIYEGYVYGDASSNPFECYCNKFQCYADEGCYKLSTKYEIRKEY